MFALTTFIEYPHLEDYKLMAAELHPTSDQAKERSTELKAKFMEEYEAESWDASGSKGMPCAVATNGEVTFRCYIADVSEG